MMRGWRESSGRNGKMIARLQACLAKRRGRRLWWVLVVALGMATSGCSARKFAINRLGDSLANSGTTFAADNDPEFVGQAIPFSLKLIEGLLAEETSRAAVRRGQRSSPSTPTSTCNSRPRKSRARTWRSPTD
jgi:hypothetical protein